MLFHKVFKRSGQSRSSWNKLAQPYGNKRLLDLDRFWFIQRGISWPFSNKAYIKTDHPLLVNQKSYFFLCLAANETTSVCFVPSFLVIQEYAARKILVRSHVLKIVLK